MKTLTGLILIFFSLSVSAQKRNIIKPVCFDWDYMDHMVDGSNENLSNVYSFRLGYERLIGSRVSAGLNYVGFLSADKTGVDESFYYYIPAEYQPEAIPGYRFSHADYSNKIRGIEYESRYFFNELENDGLNSGYIGFIYNYLSAKQSLSNVSYWDNSGSAKISKEYADKNISIHRFGLKLGYAVSGAIYSDLHLGIYYNNRPDDYNKGWTSPSDIYPVNVVLGWHFGLPF